MRILLLSDYGVLQGGAEQLTFWIRDELRRRGHDARVLASCVASHADRSLADYSCLGTAGRWRTVLQTVNPFAAAKLRRVLAEFRPDVVHMRLFLTQLSPLVLRVLRSTPTIYQEVLYRPACLVGSKTLPDGSLCTERYGMPCLRNRCVPVRDFPVLMLQSHLFHRWKGAIDLVICSSTSVQQSLAGVGIHAELLPNGVPATARRPPLSYPPTVAAAGRLVTNKGFHVLLRALALVQLVVPDVRLVIAGEGPERDALGTLAAQLGVSDRVTWAGHLGWEALQSRLGSAWVQAVPSFSESFGLVAAEALGRGTAVVASDVGGLSTLVRPGIDGELVEPNQPVALAEALTRFLVDREWAERFGSAGAQHVRERYSLELMVRRLESAYAQVTTGSGWNERA